MTSFVSRLESENKRSCFFQAAGTLPAVQRLGLTRIIAHFHWTNITFTGGWSGIVPFPFVVFLRMDQTHMYGEEKLWGREIVVGNLTAKIWTDKSFYPPLPILIPFTKRSKTDIQWTFLRKCGTPFRRWLTLTTSSLNWKNDSVKIFVKQPVSQMETFSRMLCFDQF